MRQEKETHAALGWQTAHARMASLNPAFSPCPPGEGAVMCVGRTADRRRSKHGPPLYLTCKGVRFVNTPSTRLGWFLRVKVTHSLNAE